MRSEGPLFHPSEPFEFNGEIEKRLVRRHEPFEIEGVGHLYAPPSTFAQDAAMSRFVSAISIQADTWSPLQSRA